jgi:hypothetical protein
MLDTTTARAFNSSLKKALQKETGLKVSVEIINSYNFPKCWVRVHAPRPIKFSNELRQKVFTACGYDSKGLGDSDDICYGNIMPSNISAHVPEWQKVFPD